MGGCGGRSCVVGIGAQVGRNMVRRVVAHRMRGCGRDVAVEIRARVAPVGSRSREDARCTTICYNISI